MTWFAEFGQVVHEVAHLGHLRHLEAAEAALHSGDPSRLFEAFPGGVRIDDPRLGRVDDEASSKEFCEASEAWLASTAARPIAVTNGRSQVVGEFSLELTKDGQAMVLPVAVVVEPNPAEQGVWIRTYSASACGRITSPR